MGWEHAVEVGAWLAGDGPYRGPNGLGHNLPVCWQGYLVIPHFSRMSAGRLGYTSAIFPLVVNS